MVKSRSDQPKSEVELADQLREMFDTVADQPVPAQILDLVEALEEKRRWNEAPEPEAD